MKPFLALLLALNCCAAEIKIFFSPHGGCIDAVVQQLSRNGQTRGDQTHDESLNAVEQLWNGKLKRD